MGSARSTLPHIESARTGDEEEIGETRNTLPHTSSARTGEQLLFRDTRTRDQDDAFGDTRTGIRTTFGTRAPYNFVLTNDLHMRMTEETVERHSRVPTTRATPLRFRASYPALRFRHLMGQIQPSSVLGLFNLKL